MDYVQVKEISDSLGVGEYFRFLPLIFTYRTINSTKTHGGKANKEDVEFLKGNDEGNFEKISTLLQKLPQELMFIFKAMHTVSLHNRRAGGDTRYRLFLFTQKALEADSLNKTWFQAFLFKMWVYFKIFLFENLYWVYRRIFGKMELKFGEDGKLKETKIVY